MDLYEALSKNINRKCSCEPLEVVVKKETYQSRDGRRSSSIVSRVLDYHAGVGFTTKIRYRATCKTCGSLLLTSEKLSSIRDGFKPFGVKVYTRGVNLV